jgi:hypothetical protein
VGCAPYAKFDAGRRDHNHDASSAAAWCDASSFAGARQIPASARSSSPAKAFSISPGEQGDVWPNHLRQGPEGGEVSERHDTSSCIIAFGALKAD